MSGERTVHNPHSRGGPSLREAMEMQERQAPFDPNNLPGGSNVGESDMLRLLAQNVELRPSARAPQHIQNAMMAPDYPGRGPEADGVGRAAAPQYAPPPAPAPAPAPNFIPPPHQRQENMDRAMPLRQERPAGLPPAPTPPGVPPGVPDHIKEMLSRVDNVRSQQQEFDPMAQQDQYARDAYPPLDPGTEEISEGMDTLPPPPPGTADRSPRLPPRPSKKPPITNNANGPRAAPELTEAEKDAARAKSEAATAAATTPTRPRFVLREIDRSGAYTRVALVSGFVFYDNKDVQVRKFNLQDAMNIAQAKENNNLTGLIDAVGASLADGFDVRDLTMGDFLQIMYWHRFHSYQTIPFILNWESKYGNKTQYRLLDSEVKYKTMTVPESEIEPWIAEGFTVPRVRDFELFQREPMSKEEKYLVTRAQFFTGYPGPNGGPPDIQDKIDMLNDRCAENLDALGRITAWSDMTDHGVIETVFLRDEKFNADTHALKLRGQLDMIHRNVDRLLGLDTDEARRDALMLEMQSDELIEEIAKFEGTGVAADVEVVPLNIPLLNFFPTL